MATKSSNVDRIAVVQLLIIMLARALFGALVCCSAITTAKVVDRKTKLTKSVDESQGKKISHFSVEVEGGDHVGRVLVGGYSNEKESEGTSYHKSGDLGGIRPNQLGGKYIGWGMGGGMGGGIGFDNGYNRLHEGIHRDESHNGGSSNGGGSKGNDKDNDDNSSKGNNKGGSSTWNDKDNDDNSSKGNNKDDNDGSSGYDDYYCGGGGVGSGGGRGGGGWGYS
ncbi:RNA-binding protein cabeza-like [Impatiens glandulifera]|uniref:RNA-binding protein cabeza-like n=1 Tax=Impatiens glandulifera TaxID=253017 RepID=UPI001FB12EDD|nr:RNA-binding protein cabeza-like [Impatiens glandulifera]